jgi:hypothetical protein
MPVEARKVQTTMKKRVIIRQIRHFQGKKLPAEIFFEMAELLSLPSRKREDIVSPGFFEDRSFSCRKSMRRKEHPIFKVQGAKRSGIG